MTSPEKIIINANVITSDGIIWDGYVRFRRKILDVGRACDFNRQEDCEIIDARGKYVAPGLIDVHNHGTGYYNFNEDPLYCCERIIKHGVTTVLPTLYTSLTLDDMLEAAEKIRKFRQTGVGRIMNGLYMEGPYMDSSLGSYSDLMKWAGLINPDDYICLVDGVSDIARVWAIDPAREGITDFMKYVRRKSPYAVFSLGHSSATFEQCESVACFGISLQTHHGDSGKAKGKARRWQHKHKKAQK